MTPQNMQEARELVDDQWHGCVATNIPNGTYYNSIDDEDVPCGACQNVKDIALALSKAEARGRLVGLEEGAKDKENRIHDLELKLAGLYGYADIQGMEFVKHIKAHLKDGQEVICKICGKTVEQIALEAVE